MTPDFDGALITAHFSAKCGCDNCQQTDMPTFLDTSIVYEPASSEIDIYVSAPGWAGECHKGHDEFHSFFPGIYEDIKVAPRYLAEPIGKALMQIEQMLH